MKRRLNTIRAGLARIALVPLALVVPLSTAQAQAGMCWGADIAERTQVHQLDVMLKVNSLLCRNSADDFRPQYDWFLLRHRAALTENNARIIDSLSASVGLVRAYAEMDRGTVAMANHYGDRSGLGCHDLKRLTADLALITAAELPMAAQLLVGDDLAVDSCETASPYARRLRTR